MPYLAKRILRGKGVTAQLGVACFDLRQFIAQQGFIRLTDDQTWLINSLIGSKAGTFLQRNDDFVRQNIESGPDMAL